MLEFKCKKCNQDWVDFDLELNESEDFQTDKDGNIFTVCNDCKDDKQ